MQKNRAGFAFEVAVGAIVLIGIALIVLIVMFYRASTTEVAPAYSPLVVETAQEVEKKSLSTYLDKLEHYKERAVSESSVKASAKKTRTNVVARGSEVSENSIVKVIDEIVTEALAKTKKEPTLE